MARGLETNGNGLTTPPRGVLPAPGTREPGGPGPVVFERSVPRRFVHKAAVSNVLISQFTPDVVADTFRVTARWPQTHGHYRPRQGFHDPTLLAETVRQAGLVVGHAGYGIPMDHRFVMHRLGFAVDRRALSHGDRPAELVFTASCFAHKRRGGQVIGCECSLTVERGAQCLGTAFFRFTTCSPSAYLRIRGTRAQAVPGPAPEPAGAAGAEPALVGRDEPQEVVLTGTGTRDTWLLRVDPRNPLVADHPDDHVPGMVLVEAARQAARLMLDRAGAVVVGLDAEFTRYVELDGRAQVRAERLPRHTPGENRVRVLVTDDGRPAAQIVLTVADAG